MYYRLSQDIKSLFINFFGKIFTLYKEDKITFNDGRRVIKFAKAPICEELDTYKYKDYPVVLASINPGMYRDASFNKHRDVDITTGETISGWIATFTVSFLIYALTKEDRDQLSDIVCVYLSKAETKQAFEVKGIRLMMPSFSGDSAEDDPQTNVKRFYTVVSIQMEADVEDTLTIVDSQGRSGLTVTDILSYIGDADGNGEISNLNG